MPRGDETALSQSRSAAQQDYAQARHPAKMRLVGRPDQDAILEFKSGRRHNKIIGGNQLTTPTKLRIEIRPSLCGSKSEIHNRRSRQQRVDLGATRCGASATPSHLHSYE